MLHAHHFTGQPEDDKERAVRPEQVWPTLGGIAMLSCEYFVHRGSNMLGLVQEAWHANFPAIPSKPTIRAGFDPGATGMRHAGMKWLGLPFVSRGSGCACSAVVSVRQRFMGLSSCWFRVGTKCEYFLEGGRRSLWRWRAWLPSPATN